MFPLVYYRIAYTRDGPKIVQAVQRTCDVSRPMLSRAMGVPVRNLRRIERGREELGASAWFQFCRVFLLPPECFSSGYSRRAHLAVLADTIERGEYGLTPSARFYRRAVAARQRHERATQALSAAILTAPFEDDIGQPGLPGLRVDLTSGFFRRHAQRTW